MHNGTFLLEIHSCPRLARTDNASSSAPTGDAKIPPLSSTSDDTHPSKGDVRFRGGYMDISAWLSTVERNDEFIDAPGHCHNQTAHPESTKLHSPEHHASLSDVWCPSKGFNVAQRGDHALGLNPSTEAHVHIRAPGHWVGPSEATDQYARRKRRKTRPDRYTTRKSPQKRSHGGKRPGGQSQKVKPSIDRRRPQPNNVYATGTTRVRLTVSIVALA